MIRSLLTGGIIDYIIETVCMLPGIVIGLCFHEYAHAYVADKCGDPTPRSMGRVSLNPSVHIDPYGFIALLLVHFGWGRPVVINPFNFKKQRRDSFFVAIAGVTMNFIIGTCVGLLIRLLLHIQPTLMFLATTDAGGIVFDILLDIVVINYGLMLFNLLPVPPLDGFNIVTEVFNLHKNKTWAMLYRYGSLILIVIIIADIPSYLLGTPLNWLVNVVCFM